MVRLMDEASQISHELEQYVKKLRCTGETGLTIESFTDIKIGVDPSPVDVNSQTYDVYTTEESSLADENNNTVKVVETEGFPLERIHGKGVVHLSSGHIIRGEFYDGRRQGQCEVVFNSENPYPGAVKSIRGEYKNGKLNGKARVFFNDRTWLEGFFKEGIQHGFARTFDKKGRLKFVSNYQNGKAVGIAWKINRGGGCVVGRVNSRGVLSGIRLGYIYPDFMTVLVGTFEDGVFRQGQEANIVSIIQDSSGIKIPVYSRPHGPIHTRQIGEFDHICKDPLVEDPYEKRMIGVGTSKISGAAEGLFAKKDIEPNTVISFYNGSRARPESFDPSTWETNNYRIFDPANMPHGTIDIPVWAQSSSKYRSTMAHKCNHSFQPNSEFVVYDHPKFGLIPCLLTVADIPKGGEILVGYGYDLTDSPEWYQKAWKESIYGQQGVSYHDWLNCNVKKPIVALNYK